MSFRDLSCVTCGCQDYTVRYQAKIPVVEDLDFSARRPGNHYHPRIVSCNSCGQIYSNPFFSDEIITKLYRAAKYIDEPQLSNMTADYVREFKAAVGDRRGTDLRLLEIGCANGFFLHALQAAGYVHLWGVEPGEEAVSRAPEEIRPYILSGFFGANTFPRAAFDVVCCFQVMDHLPNPAQFMRDVHDVIADDGLFLAINHDIRSPITRLLGEKSPMYDIEHIYLFDSSTIRKLFKNAGFDVVDCRPLYNSYTLDYALKMLPLPSVVKMPLSALLRSTGIGRLSVQAPGGNMITVGRKRNS